MKLAPLSSSSSSLVMLNSKSGILELIANYAGTPKAQELRTFRQLIYLLPAFIEDVPLTALMEEKDFEEEGDY